MNRIIAGLKEWSRRRRSIRELAALTDRELSDLGIARSDIRAVVDDALKVQSA